MKTLGLIVQAFLLQAHDSDSLSLTELEETWNSFARLYGVMSDVVDKKKLVASVRAMVAASTYQPRRVTLGEITLPVHNRYMADLLQTSYLPSSFRRVAYQADIAAALQIEVNPENGLIMTSTGGENKNMSERSWITDTIRSLELLSSFQRSDALLSVCRFYNQAEEVESFNCAIADPNWYRLGGIKNGVAHIFMPASLKRDAAWFNNKRLESHALALSALSREVRCMGQEHQSELSRCMIADKECRKLVVTTISNLVAYLKAVNTDPRTGKFDFAAPSAGNWEENPFPGGLTWDTEATRSAFVAVKDLMNYAHDLSDLKDLLYEIAATKNGGWLFTGTALDRLIQAARRKVLVRLHSGDGPMEHPQRPMDASLSFIATSDIVLSRSADRDAKLMFQLLEDLERGLVRDNGMIRYQPFSLNGTVVPDSYLAQNYWLSPELRSALSGEETRAFGSEDCSTPEALAARTGQARAKTAAQWCWTSVLAEGYAQRVIRLLEIPGTLTTSRRRLALKGLSKATEMINRSYARITSEGKTVKSNGLDCPPRTVVEAFEYVSTVDGRMVALPGVNTGFAWGFASLRSASRRFNQALTLAQSRGVSG